VTVGTRLPVRLEEQGGWGDTTLRLPAGRWRDLLAGDRSGDVLEGDVWLKDLLSELPVALLVKES